MNICIITLHYLLIHNDFLMNNEKNNYCNYRIKKTNCDVLLKCMQMYVMCCVWVIHNFNNNKDDDKQP